MKRDCMPITNSSSAQPLPPARPSSRFWVRAAVAVLAVHALLIVATFRDYGISWDQIGGHLYQNAVIRFYASHGTEKYAQEMTAKYYGAFFDLCATAVERITHLRWFEARGLTSALLGWIGTYAILRAGWIAFAPPVGVMAAVFLLLTPVYYGHEFINPKDAPFAAMAMLALYYMIRLAKEYPAPRWTTAIKTGLALGMAMGVRVGGLVLFGPLAVALVLTVIIGWWQIGFRASFKPTLWLALQLGLIFPLAWAVMVAVWPFAWTDPIEAPRIALAEFAKYPWDGNVFYEGKLLKPWDLPWTYVPNLLVRTLPEHILLGLLAGVLSFGLIRRTTLESSRMPVIATCVLLAAFVWPLGVIWSFESNLYDGYRQVLFIVPPLILLAAAGTWGLVHRLKQPAVKRGVIAVFGLALVVVAYDLVSLHPYEYIYFNRSVAGGLPRANRSYDLDYWATAVREATEWVVKNYSAPSGTTVIYSMNDGEPDMVEELIHARPASGIIFRRAVKEEKATLQFLIRRERQTSEPTEGRVLHVVRRQGVPLVDVVETP